MSKLKVGRLKALLKVIQLIYKDDASTWDITYKQCGSFICLLIYALYKHKSTTSFMPTTMPCAELCPLPFLLTQGVLVSSFMLACSIAALGVAYKKSQAYKHNFRGLTSLLFLHNDIIQQVGYHNKYNIASNGTLEARPSLNNIQSRKTYWEI